MLENRGDPGESLCDIPLSECGLCHRRAGRNVRGRVYPSSQFGASGLAFEAGVKGKNLTEWQYGLASLKPRWNVSGSYMQALPRVVSTDKETEKMSVSF